MRLTMAGEYAVRAILYLSHKGQGVLTSRKEISEHCDVPSQFLAKIAQRLAKSGFIEILQGKSGGYILVKQPQDISLLDVIESVTGEITLNQCVVRPESCKMSNECTVHEIWVEARRKLRSTLKQATFEKLMEKKVCTTIKDNSDNI